MGSILDAFQEGYHPKARPMNTETPTARAMASGEEAVVRERRDWSDFYRACHEVGQ